MISPRLRRAALLVGVALAALATLNAAGRLDSFDLQRGTDAGQPTRLVATVVRVAAAAPHTAPRHDVPVGVQRAGIAALLLLVSAIAPDRRRRRTAPAPRRFAARAPPFPSAVPLLA